ncbi:MAG: gamma-glutamyl-gamma-aminobutyrate hydrolase family protein [Bacilli bacterium]|nr:gamma-glutamyl-gamma-aminobutyrate hydrolase family protein [Bacilli bacterium]
MNNITIGIIARDEKINETNIQAVTKNNLKYLHNKCNYIGILNYDNSPIDTEILSICDGIIIQGGSDIYPYHFQILDYAIKNNIPILGICMGHQIIGLYSINSNTDNDLIKISNHYNKEKLHTIKTISGSVINKLLGDTHLVNSRHLEAVDKVKSPFKVTAMSEDNIIEAIEYIDDEHFVIGVQFHPEDLDNTENLYNYFIKEILKRKK